MPIWEYHCPKCNKLTEEFFHRDPPRSILCGTKSCGGAAERTMSVFQGPEQMKNMGRLARGQGFVKRRHDWRENLDKGKITPPPR